MHRIDPVGPRERHVAAPPVRRIDERRDDQREQSRKDGSKDEPRRAFPIAPPPAEPEGAAGPAHPGEEPPHIDVRA